MISPLSKTFINKVLYISIHSFLCFDQGLFFIVTRHGSLERWHSFLMSQQQCMSAWIRLITLKIPTLSVNRVSLIPPRDNAGMSDESKWKFRALNVAWWSLSFRNDSNVLKYTVRIMARVNTKAVPDNQDTIAAHKKLFSSGADRLKSWQPLPSVFQCCSLPWSRLNAHAGQAIVRLLWTLASLLFTTSNNTTMGRIYFLHFQKHLSTR